MRAARLATLALLFCQVGQDTISTVIPFSKRSGCRSRQSCRSEIRCQLTDERPDTQVTNRTGHIGYTFGFLGGKESGAFVNAFVSLVRRTQIQ